MMRETEEEAATAATLDPPDVLDHDRWVIPPSHYKIPVPFYKIGKIFF